ncbi:hypothetical protein D9M68_830880 [compost metagenome]
MELVPVDRVDLAAAVIGALARVAAVGEEHIQVEEVAAVTVAVSVGEAVHTLGELVRVVRVGELLAVAEADTVVHPFEDLARFSGKAGWAGGDQSGAKRQAGETTHSGTPFCCC